jgi:hypothetical protein
MLRWSRHVAYMGEKKNAYTIFREHFEKRGHLEDINGGVINVKIDVPGIKWKGVFIKKNNKKKTCIYKKRPR